MAEFKSQVRQIGSAMKRIFFILAMIGIGFIGCDKEEVVCLDVSPEFLQGKWKDYCDQCNNLFRSRHYFFSFTSDSFKMIKGFATDLLYADCEGKSNWEIYAKGKVLLSDDLFVLDGFYCDDNFNKLTISPCHHVIDTGAFYMEFNNVYYCNDTLVLQNTSLNEWNGLIKLKRE